MSRTFCPGWSCLGIVCFASISSRCSVSLLTSLGFELSYGLSKIDSAELVLLVLRIHFALSSILECTCLIGIFQCWNWILPRLILFFFFSFLLRKVSPPSTRELGTKFMRFLSNVSYFVGLTSGHSPGDTATEIYFGWAVRDHQGEVVPMFEFIKSMHSNKMIAPGDSKFNNWHKFWNPLYRSSVQTSAFRDEQFCGECKAICWPLYSRLIKHQISNFLIIASLV